MGLAVSSYMYAFIWIMAPMVILQAWPLLLAIFRPATLGITWVKRTAIAYAVVYGLAAVAVFVYVYNNFDAFVD